MTRTPKTPERAAGLAPVSRKTALPGNAISPPGVPGTPPSAHPVAEGGAPSSPQHRRERAAAGKQAPVTGAPSSSLGGAPGRGRASRTPAEGVGASPVPSAGLQGAEWRKAVRDAQAKGRRRKAAGKTPAASPALPLMPPDPDGYGLTATAHCTGCDWAAAGTPAEVDRATDKHTKAGHSTSTVMLPVRRTA